MRALPALAISGWLLAGAAYAHPVSATPWCSAEAVPDNAVRALKSSAARLLPGSPRAVVRIHTEGTLPHKDIWDLSMEAKKDLPLMSSLVLAWRTTRDPALLASLATVLDAWATIYQPSFNPIDETNFDVLIDAYAIARAELPPLTRDKVASMLWGWSAGYVQQMQHPSKPGKGTWVNNWQSHRIKLATLSAVALNDTPLFDASRAEFRKQLNQNLHLDGHTLDFDERDALHYAVFDLEPLVRAAMAAKTRGEDWLNLRADSGVTLAAGLDWLLPYARGEKVHEEYVRTTVRFDVQRREAGMKGFAGQWPPKSASRLYWMASTLDAKYLPVAQALTPPPPWLSACWATK